MCKLLLFWLSTAYGDAVFSIFANNGLVHVFINYPHRNLTAAFNLCMSSKNKHSMHTHGDTQWAAASPRDLLWVGGGG